MSASVPPPRQVLGGGYGESDDLVLRRQLLGEPHRARDGVVPNVLDIIRSLFRVIVAAVFVITFIAQPFRIPSESMEHTLLVGDFLLANKMIYAPPGPWRWLLPYREPERGDVIVFHYPVKPSEHVVKRVIGLPGDSVHLQDGIACINGVPLDEPYVSFEPAYSDEYRDDFPQRLYTDPGVDPAWWREMQSDVHAGELLVPPGDYFVLGDNRNFSRDSRYWGFVPRQNIVGRAFLIYFSLRKPSATDPTQNVILGKNADLLDRLKYFARWDRIGRVVH
ncbi:MAG TPA: signal peptidase I [Acidobacteriaceae bacterium]|nr:signal peptidase I [Acidobacteriaceae bacterium]